VPSNTHKGLRRPAAAFAVAAVAVTTVALATPGGAMAAPNGADEPTALYIVQLAGSPLAAYTGGVDNIPATKPPSGSKLDTRSWNYAAYRHVLADRRTAALGEAGIAGSRKILDYSVTFNGFAARLTPSEVTKLRGTAGVANVFKNDIVTVQTNNTPRFLGLSGPGGVWQTQFGSQPEAGDGVIVGVIDTGFWPENPSFAALPEPRPDADTIAAKWRGECVAGDDNPVECNNKVIGARWYSAGTADEQSFQEYRSPRDRNGHGSHTASTAAGMQADATVAGAPIGQVSGMAPGARLAIYKALWNKADGTASGASIDLVAAIDDAVADGVDVINYSIGNDVDQVDPSDVAFLNAAAAGVFVAVAAGNAGPNAGTVDNAMPWEATVGAGTHDVKYAKNVVLGNGASYEGVGLGPAVPTSPLIDSSTAAAAGQTTANATLCVLNSLDPAKIAGKIVLCTRGTNARVEKSAEVKRAGGVGMILANPVPGSQNAETHSVPTSHVGVPEGTAIKAYIAGTAAPTASLAATVQKTQEAPGVTAFSSVGPSRSSGGDLLKPDMLAPGVDITAAVPPNTNPANSFWDLKSGTSMASPHVAGIAALLKAKNPTWTPAAIKSALMTTAYQIDNQGNPLRRPDLGVAATPLEYGAGAIRPGSAFDPGLVYDSGPLDWLQYTCGIGVGFLLGDGTNSCDLTGAIDPSNLNYPSISIGNLGGKQTVTRTVTNTTRKVGVYIAKVEAPPGISVKVTPIVMTVLPNASATYTVEFTRTTAAFNTYTFGSLSWGDVGGGHTVKSPLVVRPVALAAPAEVNGTGTSGSANVPVTAGYTGSLQVSPYGLIAPTNQTSHLVGTNTTFSTTNPQPGPAVAKLTVTAPATTRATRVATFDSDYPAGTDIDIFVYSGTTLVGSSSGSSAEESVTLPGGGTFTVYVVQFALGGGRTEQDVPLHTYVVGPTNAGNFTVTPAARQVTVGGTTSFTAGWSGLSAGTRYLGVLEYSDGSATRGQTLVTVRT
jgi:subtilisin family serine protease